MTKKKDEKIAEEINNKEIIEALNKQIEELNISLETEKNKSLYNQAELINYKRRKDEEVSNLLKYANKDLILDLLPIIDNFGRALKTEVTDENKKILEGIKILNNHFLETLKKYEVIEIDALGKIFDPNEQEAMLTDKDESKEDEIVLEVLTKGYKLKDRVIRHAIVKVNKLD